MASAKDISVKTIPSNIATAFVKRHHYSGKVVNSSCLHFGCFLDGVLHGVMSFGSPLDRRKVLGLVVDKDGAPAPWNDMLELNRMAFDDVLPKNSESRCIAIAIRLIRKYAPHIKWIISFADGAHCGDGTIYRASGFSLTGVSEASMIELPERLWKYNGGGKYAHRISLQAKSNILYKVIQSELGMHGECMSMEKYAEKLGTKVVEGFQLRYIKVLDPAYRIKVPILPFSTIDEIGAGMYKSEKITQAERHAKK